MTKTTGAPSPSGGGASSSKRKAAAARKERTPEKRTYEFLGHELELPGRPKEELLFDLVEMEIEEENPIVLTRMLRSLLGPDQFLLVRNLIAAQDGEKPYLVDLLTGLLEEYGMSLGESEASSGS